MCRPDCVITPRGKQATTGGLTGKRYNSVLLAHTWFGPLNWARGLYNAFEALFRRNRDENS